MKKIILLGFFIISTAFQATAQETTSRAIEDRRYKTPSDAIGALGSDLFGEQTDHNTGSTSFSATDIDLPGNNALPVRLTRSMKVAVSDGFIPLVPLGGSLLNSAGWSIDVPNLSGIFASNGNAPGWIADSASPSARCSTGSGKPPAAYTYAEAQPEGFWSGIHLSVPGQVSNDILLSTQNTQNNTSNPSRWTTKDHWLLRCLPALTNGGVGEGFLATSPNGTKYYFDRMISRSGANRYSIIDTGIQAPQLGGSSTLKILRVRFHLVATRVEDRFGNYVLYNYDIASKLNSISSSDGRQINFTYNSNNVVTSVSAHGKTWIYQYGTDGKLSAVVLPDASAWTFTQTGNLFRGAIPVNGEPSGSSIYCNNGIAYAQTDNSYNSIDYISQVVVKHPSGAIGTFDFNAKEHYNPWETSCSNYEFAKPLQYVDALISKKINGPGMQQQMWGYSYDNVSIALNADNCQLGQCPTLRATHITQTDGAVQTFNFRLNGHDAERSQIVSEITSKSLIELKRSSNTYVAANASGVGFNTKVGSHPLGNLIPSMANSEYELPTIQQVSQQDGVVFTRQVNQFDSFAQPVSITKSSSLGYTTTDSITYENNLSKWVLGQVKTVTNANTNQIASQTNYDAATALPLQSYSFGLLQSTMSYNLDGTLATVKDAKNNTTSLSNYKRGIPQTISFADGTGISGVVNDSGWVSSVTDQLGSATNYQYDAMGRLSAILYPTGDTNAWNATSISFQQINSVEHGLPAGHWRQSIYQGNKHTNKYLDALWRPVMVEELDATNIGNTVRQTINKYDTMGRQVFQSYPITWVDDFNTATVGIHTEYDALGRVTKVKQDSELGQLTTTTEYLAGFQTKVTNPKGVVTRQGYQVFDAPDTSRPVFTVYAEGTAESKISDVIRDVFGKATYTQMRNPSSSQYFGRSYVFDVNERLCKTVVPEQGATHYEYDANNNVIRMAEGDHTYTTRACDAGNIALANKTVTTYDVMNRVTNVDVPGGNFGDKSYLYEADGLVKQINTVSNNSGIINRYFYNKRRMLVNEQSEQTGWYNWGVGYDYNNNAALSRTTYPSGFYVDYAPNGLGQATQAASVHGNWANAVQYYPNGAVKQFTYGNGIVHTMYQNARQLPSATVAKRSNQSIQENHHVFDANGNVSIIGDPANGERNWRGMQYDALDRLTQVHSPNNFGFANYQYDALDNLKRSTLGLAGFTYNYDASNRLSRVDRDGGSSYNYAYDGKGNVTHNGRNWFTYDGANRMYDAAGVEGYRYDGNNRRVLAWAPVGGSIMSMYGQDGVLYYQHNERETQNYEYIYLNGDPIAFRNYNWANGMPNATLKTRFQHTDALGSPVATTDEAGNVVDRTEYAPYGAPLNRPVSGVGYTGHVMDQNTGLVYAQQRYYDPMLGRFLSPDPMASDMNTGWNFNRYNYAANNPFKFTDPDGRACDSPSIACDGGTLPDAPPGTGRAMGGLALDFTPILGDAKGLYDAYQDPSAINIIAAGVGFVPLAGDAVAKVLKVGDKILDAKKATGTYTNIHESGIKYHGKGSADRMNTSAADKAKANKDPVVNKAHTPAANSREAFKEEAKRIAADGGPGKGNYNKINSPGAKYIKEDKP